MEFSSYDLIKSSRDVGIRVRMDVNGNYIIYQDNKVFLIPVRDIITSSDGLKTILCVDDNFMDVVYALYLYRTQIDMRDVFILSNRYYLLVGDEYA